MILALVNLKGGTGKTTSAAFLAHALHERGRRVLLVDADPQGSALRWSEDAEVWPVATVALPTKRLHQRLDDVAGGRFDDVVIDTPPLEENAGIVNSVLRVASHVLVPVAPTPIEVERVGAVAEAVEDSAAVRREGEAPRMALLLTRTVPNASSTGVYREVLTTAGHRVLPGEVRRVERFAQAWGDPITRAAATAYGDALDALEVPA
ncbi:ParA family protein [Actinomycetospora soli]|uniref:ParA family protein n=1 Tax=Actinomycetospora soli TaxID=2893887 RepID=UPI001E439F84|nr:ParA family protein [Actinomycetospora soli]MCD2191730.1 ParA family protein [Actinomycetospora soli]